MTLPHWHLSLQRGNVQSGVVLAVLHFNPQHLRIPGKQAMID